MTVEVRDPAFERRVRESVERQTFMATLGAVLDAVEPGLCRIHLPFRADLTQQHGFMHAGALSSVVDSACGYAALTLMDPSAAVLSVEFKVNLLAPAEGELLIAEGRVVKSGRTLTVCSGEAMAVSPKGRKLVATMTATMIAVRDRGLAD